MVKPASFSIEAMRASKYCQEISFRKRKHILAEPNEPAHSDDKDPWRCSISAQLIINGANPCAPEGEQIQGSKTLTTTTL